MAIITKEDFGGTGGTSSDLGDRNKGAGTSAPPADQEILYNNASAASTTSIFIDDNDLDGADRSASIAEATSGILTISDKENGEDNYDKFKISGVADNTGYFTFTVVWLESKGTISGEVNVGVDIVKSFSALGNFSGTSINLNRSGYYNDYNPSGVDINITLGSDNVDGMRQEVEVSFQLSESIIVPVGTRIKNNSFASGLAPQPNTYLLILEYKNSRLYSDLQPLEIITPGTNPEVNNISMVGDFKVGNSITGNYTGGYFDADGDAEDVSANGSLYELKLYDTLTAANNDTDNSLGTSVASGNTGGSSISGLSYTILSGDVGKYLKLWVIVRDSTGAYSEWTSSPVSSQITNVFDPNTLSPDFWDDTNRAFTGGADFEDSGSSFSTILVNNADWDLYLVLDITSVPPASEQFIMGSLNSPGTVERFALSMRSGGTAEIWLRADAMSVNIFTQSEHQVASTDRFIVNIRSNAGALEIHIDEDGTGWNQLTMDDSVLSNWNGLNAATNFYFGNYNANGTPGNGMVGNIYGRFIKASLLGATDRENLRDYLYNDA